MIDMIHRSDTKPIFVRDLQIGGNNEVVMQSMCTTRTKDVEATVQQILELEEVGCQLVRLTCPTLADCRAIAEIKQRVNIPIVADIHFQYKCALAAMEAGVDKIRINPGNIGSEERIAKVVAMAKEKHIPIRIGVNAGSLEQHIIEKNGYPTAEGMVESARYHVQILEKLGFYDIAISLKSSDVQMSIDAYRLAAEEFPYPLHLGITEAGPAFAGTIKSAAGLGVLLEAGIGSTMRVSLTTEPVEEIKVAKELLKNFSLAHNVPTLIACPTCGRIEIDLFAVAKEVEEYLEQYPVNIKVAVLGCAVNGPGEAREADIGIAGSLHKGILFKHGEVIKEVPEAELVSELKKEIDILANAKLAEMAAKKASVS
jgi:(E)-4-hydroxy-3-methylbut-2-enyl-diphosphate synthase